MAASWGQLLLLLLAQQTALVRCYDRCSETQSCGDGMFCCNSSVTGCCKEAERTAEIGYIVGGVLAMLAAGGYGYWRYKASRRTIGWRRKWDQPALPAAPGGRPPPPLPPPPPPPPGSMLALPAPPDWTPDAADTPPWTPLAAPPSETSPLLPSAEPHWSYTASRIA